jgi:hypothetical protein
MIACVFRPTREVASRPGYREVDIVLFAKASPTLRSVGRAFLQIDAPHEIRHDLGVAT